MTIKIKILTIFLILIAAYLVFAAIGIIRYKMQFKKMTPVETGFITESLVSLKIEYVNSFLVKISTGNYIAIDSGLSSDQLKDEMVKVNIDPDLVIAVFLTHTDYDHTGGLELFKNALIYMSEKEEIMIDGTTSRGPMMKNQLNLPYETLKDNEKVTIEDVVIQLIPLPGHTKGSAGYFINDKLLFTGDALKIEKGIGKLFIPSFNMDSGQLKQSIGILSDYKKAQFVMTSHFGISEEIEKLIEDIQ